MSRMSGKKLIISLWLVVFILASMVFAAPWAASPDSLVARTMTQSIDDKIETTMELAAASSAASLAVSALPGDMATPISEKLADFGGGFLLVLCVLYFEKSMFTVIGLVLFALIVPAVLLLLLISQFRKEKAFRTFAGCLLISGCLIWLMVPVSLIVSDMVYATQQSVIQETIESSGDLSLEIEEGVKDETDGEQADGDQNFVSRVLTTVSSVSSETVKKAKDLITKYLRALALMIVTACVIPVVVMLIFLWLVKLVFRISFLSGMEMREELTDVVT